MSAKRQGRESLAMLVVAIAAALSLGYGLWGLVADTAPAAGEGGATAAPGRAGSTTDRARPALVARPGTGSATLSGRVVDTGGNPVAAAQITAELELGPGVRGRPPAKSDPTVVVVAVSDGDGRFSLEGIEPGRHRLRVEGDGVLTAELRFVDAPGEDLQIVIAREVVVSGTVVTGAGEPAVAAEVHLRSETLGRSWTTTSAADGSFVFDGLAGGRFVAWAIAGDRAAAAALVDRLGAPPHQPLDLTLEPAEIVSGRVVERERGRGVSARVTLRPEEGLEAPRTAIAAADGSFEIAGVLPGRWIADAEAPGYVAAESLTFSAGRGFSPTLELSRGAVVAGVVVDGDGVPVAGAVVSLDGDDRGGQGRDYAGHLAMTASSNRLIPMGELGVLRGPIPFPPPPGALTVRVASPIDDDTGDEPAEPELEVDPELASRFVSDASGTFRITGVAAGRYQLVASHPDFATAVAPPLRLAHGQSRRDLRVVLRRGVIVRGEITDDGGLPIAGATITARFVTDAAALGELYAISDADGRYRLGAIARPVDLEVSSVGHARAGRRVAIGPRDRDERVESFVLASADAELRGRIVDGTGFAVRGARVAVAGGRAVGAIPAVTDEHGRFAIARLPAGDHELSIEHDDYPPRTLQASTERAAEIELGFGGGISVEVVDAQSSARLAGARVTATGPGGASASATTDEGGRAALTPLPVGAWRLTVEATDRVPARRSVKVLAGDRVRPVTAADLRFELLPGATVAGELRDDGGDRVAGAEIRVGTAVTTTDQDGRFRMPLVPTGDVVIEARHGELRGTRAIHLDPGDEVLTLELSLDPPPE